VVKTQTEAKIDHTLICESPTSGSTQSLPHTLSVISPRNAEVPTSVVAPRGLAFFPLHSVPYSHAGGGSLGAFF